MNATPHFILTIRCKDAVGIVAAVASALATAEAFITESSHFGALVAEVRALGDEGLGCRQR